MNRVDVYRRMKSPVAPFVRRHWRAQPFVGAAGLARRYLAIYGNHSHDLHVNGEAAYLRRLPVGSVRTAIDVGCHEGEWTHEVLVAQPEAIVHAFEATPATAVGLRARYGREPRVRLVETALGPEDGKATLYLNDRSSSLNSLVYDPAASVTPVQVPMARGDTYLVEQGIDHVDLLKIDTEGFDLQVLRGFSDALGAGAISVVQFEYNQWNVLSRSLLADFHDLLAPLGYRIGKVHPADIDFKEYEVGDEDWSGPACIAVRSDRPDLLRPLAGARRG